MGHDSEDCSTTGRSKKIHEILGDEFSITSDTYFEGAQRDSRKKSILQSTEKIANDDAQSGLWSFHDVGLQEDDYSIPYEEDASTILPGRFGDVASVLYSIAEVERPIGDCKNYITDIEDAGSLVSTKDNKRHEKTSMETEDRSTVTKMGGRRKRCVLVLVAALLLVALGLGISIFFFYHMQTGSASLGREGNGNDSTSDVDGATSNPKNQSNHIWWSTEAPLPTPTSFPTKTATRETSAPTIDVVGLMKNYLSKSTGIEISEDPLSAFQLAIKWLIEDDFENELDQKLIQRFALVLMELQMTSASQEGFSNTSLLVQSIDECEWKGVSCINETVVELSWGSQGFNGKIPSEIGLLSDLVVLDLSQNELRGELPEQIYNLVSLEKLYLYKNGLTGKLSEKIGSLDALTHLHLSHNQFSGELPDSMRSTVTSTRSYQYINLFSNSFSGPLPTGLGWKNLWFLDLGKNTFSGILPNDIGNMPTLRHLYLDHNSFQGELPITMAEIGSGRLETLALDSNQFTGALPEWDPSLSQLVSLLAQNNSFTDKLPKAICEMGVLEGGKLVELGADCQICRCGPPFCQQC